MYSGKLLMMGRGTARNMYSFLTKKNEKISAFVGLTKNNYVTIHGHMNVKFSQIYFEVMTAHKESL
jgi:hypothetical protein